MARASNEAEAREEAKTAAEFLNAINQASSSVAHRQGGLHSSLVDKLAKVVRVAEFQLEDAAKTFLEMPAAKSAVEALEKAQRERNAKLAADAAAHPSPNAPRPRRAPTPNANPPGAGAEQK